MPLALGERGLVGHSSPRSSADVNRSGPVHSSRRAGRARKRIRTSTPPRGPAGLSRLRLPFRHPGRQPGNATPLRIRRVIVTASSSVVRIRPAAAPSRRFAITMPSTMSASTSAKTPIAQHDRDHRAAREPADRTRGSGATRWRCGTPGPSAPPHVPRHRGDAPRGQSEQSTIGPSAAIEHPG